MAKHEAVSVLVPILDRVGFDSAEEMEASGKGWDIGENMQAVKGGNKNHPLVSGKVMNLTDFHLTQKMGETLVQV